ncbi:IQ-domain 13 isoform 2 [Hibiscus syriacus]|uniref:IQ-domain 13 isoform 2 n=1 Tax=Hibiscus syriacus TaxID=106335 RepID=A0A6A2WJ09_HIBSY|nr:protein IQ-DOMAIN 14-like isoform X1 [Hibiscus syriacus]KAE8658391.1 IQ-domain 13 isoform 2 [Hibiscus syriacus]
MGKKGSWFYAIKRFFLPCSNEKLNNELDKRSNKEKKKGLGKLRHGETNSFLSLFREPSSIEKILGEAEREHNLIFRPPSPPEQPITQPIVPHKPTSPQVHSSRVASPRVTSPRAASSKSASPPGTASPYPPHPPPLQAASPHVASPRGATPKAPPRIVRPRPEPTLMNQHASATQIQAAYRGYKARRSFRSLKGLVRLQGVVRGQNARRQTTNAMKHMQLLVRVQSQIQSRRIQLFENQAQNQFKNNKEAESTLGKWISQASKADNENWDDSIITKEEREARKQRKEEAAIKRKRAMAYAYSNQLWKVTPESAYSGVSSLPSGFPWWWNRLDRHLPLRNAPKSQGTKSYQLTPTRKNSELKPSSRPQSSSNKQKQFSDDNFIETPTPKSTRSTILPATRRTQTPLSSSKSQYPRSRTSKVGSPFSTNIKDDDSLISCPPFSVPNYMNPTVSTKAKARASSNPKERYVSTPRSESNRRLSYPFTQGVGSFRSIKGSVNDTSVDSTLSTPTNATDRKPFNKFV